MEGSMAKKRRKATSKRPSVAAGGPDRAKSGSSRRYSDAERTAILEAAKREGLTGKQVRSRFGISTLTYYTWRKKAGSPAGRRRGRPPGGGTSGIDGQIREAIRERVRSLLPQILREEIGALLGSSGRGNR